MLRCKNFGQAGTPVQMCKTSSSGMYNVQLPSAGCKGVQSILVDQSVFLTIGDALS